MDIGITIAIVTIITTIILGITSVHYQKKSTDYKEKIIFPENLNFDGVTIFRGRSKTLNFAAKMFNEAEEGDTIFGMCRNCGFSNEFWNSLKGALLRGAKLQIIVSRDARIKNAKDKFKALPNSIVKISEIANMRVMGIRNKKGLIVLSTENSGYVSVYVEHDYTCKAICEPLFDSYWSKADDT